MIFTDKGIVLHSIKYGESDKLITALTENNGKIFFLAKGVRKLTSKNAAGCYPYCYSEFEIDKRGERLYLRRATPLRMLVKFADSLEKTALFAYLAELSSDTSYDADSSKNILKLLANALFVLENTDRPCALVKGVFEQRLLAELGFMPDLSACAGCSKPLAEAGEKLRFDLTEGHFFCPHCSISGVGTTVSADCLALVKRSVSVSEQNAYAVSVTDVLLKEFSAFCEDYCISQLEKTYATLDFYKEVKQL